MSRARPDAADALCRSLREAAGPFPVEFGIEEMESRGWSSITFSGARVRVRLRLEGAQAQAAADALLARTAEADLELRGHLLADLAVRAEEREAQRVRLTFDAITVEASWLPLERG